MSDKKKKKESVLENVLNNIEGENDSSTKSQKTSEDSNASGNAVPQSDYTAVVSDLTEPSPEKPASQPKKVKVSLVEFCSLIQSKKADEALSMYESHILSLAPEERGKVILNNVTFLGMTPLMHLIEARDEQMADLLYRMVQDEALILKTVGTYRGQKTNAICLACTLKNVFALKIIFNSRNEDLLYAPEGYGSPVFILLRDLQCDILDLYLGACSPQQLENVACAVNGTQIASDAYTPLEYVTHLMQEAKSNVRKVALLKKAKGILESYFDSGKDQHEAEETAAANEDEMDDFPILSKQSELSLRKIKKEFHDDEDDEDDSHIFLRKNLKQKQKVTTNPLFGPKEELERFLRQNDLLDNRPVVVPGRVKSGGIQKPDVFKKAFKLQPDMVRSTVFSKAN